VLRSEYNDAPLLKVSYNGYMVFMVLCFDFNFKLTGWFSFFKKINNKIIHKEDPLSRSI